MKNFSASRKKRSEKGVALLIAIFVVMLVSVIAIALLTASTMESALDGNYRSSASAYYAATGGLEEARGRLLQKNSDFFDNGVPNFIPMAGAPQMPFLPLGQVRFITNPANGEDVLATYPDTEYDQEFGSGSLAAATQQTIPTVSTAAGLPGPVYKWVRINAATEQSLKLDVNNDGVVNNTTPLFYDYEPLNNAKPSLIVSGQSALHPRAAQALEVTSLAVLSNGSRKLLQYVVAPVPLRVNFVSPVTQNQNFPAALTLVGSGVIFVPPPPVPPPNQYSVNGVDQGLGACLPGTPVHSVGATNASDAATISTAIGPTRAAQYSGSTPTAPGMPGDVADVSGLLPTNLQTVAGLNALVQTIKQNADVPVIVGPADQSKLPTTMSANNPLTVVVDGDLDLAGFNRTGYGILLVTGELKYDPDTSWKGVVLVIGKGVLSLHNDGLGRIDGAVLVAKTLDDSNNPLTSPGPAQFAFKDGTGAVGVGIYYSSCWVKAVQTPMTYKVLSFREIPQ